MSDKPMPPRPGRGASAARLAEILRVDHAGELGAVHIYRGQRAVLGQAPGRERITAQLAEMESHEAVHLARFDRILTDQRVRPTALAPLWRLAGFALGAGTALLGEKAAHACTEAVETVIEGHYAGQIEELAEREPELAAELARFRDEELAHRDLALEEGARDAPGYPLLAAVIRAGCHAAIKLSEKLSPEEITALRHAAEDPVTAAMADVRAVSDDLSAAFSDDPLFDWFMRTDRRRDAARTRMFRYLVGRTGIPAGRTLRPAMGGAASVWVQSFKMGPDSWWEELLALPTILGASGFSRLSRLSAMRAAMEAHHPGAQPHVYLWLLGVRPELQGLGIGSRLLRAGLDRVDAQGLPVFLETATTRNVALYRRHGFEVIAEYRPREDAPQCWAMWRKPEAG